MQIYHLSIVQNIRVIARRLRILGPLKRAIAKFQGQYEERFSTQLLEAIRPGDSVWDIGANVGYYTHQFAEKVGLEGNVLAFEPQRLAADKIESGLRVKGFKNCKVIQCAVSDFVGEATFEDDETCSVTASFADASSARAGGSKVEVTTVDEAIQKFGIIAPNVTKIDVEGFEIEVLRGGNNVFASTNSRHIFVEVHFTRLSDRGIQNPGREIVNRLKSWGYSTNWVDASHIHAFRN